MERSQREGNRAFSFDLLRGSWLYRYMHIMFEPLGPYVTRMFFFLREFLKDFRIRTEVFGNYL